AAPTWRSCSAGQRTTPLEATVVMSELRNSRVAHRALLRSRPCRPLLGWARRRLGLGRRLRGAHLLNLGVGCVPDMVSVLEQEPTARAIVMDTPDALAEVGAEERSGPGGRLVCVSARLE